jgi:NAD(P)-dependent dehydrogenase (short-subunit alcohol dehydrogenase family)
MSDWSTADIPSQSGKLAVITGTGGLGYETALALAAAGADVILAGRNETKGRQSVAMILKLQPGAQIRFELLDLASLALVAAFAERQIATDRTLDLLVNNAGVMANPKRKTTADGFELQFGTNHLGHYALTAHLLPLLRRARQPWVVTVSSLRHRSGAIHFDDLQSEQNYSPNGAYGQSKLANLMFAFELQRRSNANGWRLLSNAAHPGYALTELIPNGPGKHSIAARLSAILAIFASQSPAAGALPTLFAATSPNAQGGGYYGPNWFYELKGAPVPAFIAEQAKDVEVARKLWELSAQLTGVRWPEQ